MPHIWNSSQLSIPLVFVYLCLNMILGFASPIQAQVAPGDSLIGKTIHVFIQDDEFSRLYFDNTDKARGIFTLEAPYTYKLTLTSAIVSNKGQQDFFIRTDGSYTGEDFKYKLTPSGLSLSPTISKFPSSVFAGHSEIWIIIDPTKAQYDTPPTLLFEAPKKIHILNPWPNSGPQITSSTGNRAMFTSNAQCGWFWTLLLDSAMFQLRFKELNVSSGQTFGKNGLGSSDDFDLRTEFAAKGPEIWLNTQTKEWSAVKPNVKGDCQYIIPSQVRDFSRYHPDFEYSVLTGSYHQTGLIQTNLSLPSRKPIRSTVVPKTPMTFDTFDSWWQTDSTNSDSSLRSFEIPFNISMSKTSDGKWEYDSYRDSPIDRGFFPLEGSADRFPLESISACYVKPPPDSTYWVTSSLKRNFNFCLESHSEFKYQPGQTFSVRGDDDIWVFINNKLVIDLGGMHPPLSGKVDLDALGLVPGQSYNWDFFLCDRQPCSSALNLETSIIFGNAIPTALKGSSIKSRNRSVPHTSRWNVLGKRNSINR